MAYLEKAYQGKNGVWRYLIMTLLIFLILLLANGGSAFVIYLLGGNMISPEFMDFAKMGIDPALGILLITSPFLVALIALLALFKPFHLRPIKTLLTAFEKFRFKRMALAAGIYLGLAIAMESVLYLMNPENYTFQFQEQYFFQLVLVSLIMFPFQSGFEEVYFRGYLLQGLGLLFRYRWVAMLASSLLFGLLHLANPEASTLGWPMALAYYSGFGFLLAVTVVMDKGLEVAIGIHSINNIYNSILLTFPNSTIPTPALFSLKELDPVSTTLGWVVISLIFLVIGSKIFGWKDWSVIGGRIVPPAISLETEEVLENAI